MAAILTESIREMERRKRRRKRGGLEREEEHTGWRPQTRADCARLPRPCPYVGCKYHLFLDVRDNGTIRYNFGFEVEVLEEMRDTCALDVAARGEGTHENVAAAVGLNRERVRQEIESSVDKLRRSQAVQPNGDVRLQHETYSKSAEDLDATTLRDGRDEPWLLRMMHDAQAEEAR